MRTMLRLLTIKQKIVISYIVILAISLMMVFASVSTIRGNSETAVNQMDFLQQRYDRTRRVMDATYAFHVQVRKMAIEGGYNFVDLGNDANTVIDGEFTTYYPNGREKWHGQFVNGKRHGYFTMQMRDGGVAVVQYNNGVNVHNYFTVTRADGSIEKHSLDELKALM